MFYVLGAGFLKFPLNIYFGCDTVKLLGISLILLKLAFKVRVGPYSTEGTATLLSL